MRRSYQIPNSLKRPARLKVNSLKLTRGREREFHSSRVGCVFSDNLVNADGERDEMRAEIYTAMSAEEKGTDENKTESESTADTIAGSSSSRRYIPSAAPSTYLLRLSAH